MSQSHHTVFYLLIYCLSSGGARGAPTIRHDDDWGNLKGQLSKTKASTDVVQVTIALNDLEPFKNHKRVGVPL